MEYVKCDLCDRDDPVVLFTGGDRMMKRSTVFRVVRCRNCGLVYVRPRPDARDISQYYPAEYEPYAVSRGGFKSAAKRMVLARDAAWVRNLLGNEARVLEVGCAGGDFLAYLRDVYAWDVMGVEIDSNCAARAQSDLGLNVRTGSIDDAELPSSYFDGVILKHTIEHLHSPSSALDEIHRVLRPGGKVFLWLPNLESVEARIFGKYWSGYDVPRHLYTFSVSSITKMLEKSDLNVLRVGFSNAANDWIRSLSYLAGGCRATQFVRRIASVDNPIALLLFILPSWLSAQVGKGGRMKVVAEKGLNANGA
ncbi:MAG: class I SAM-dependent methyltransferase [Chloroflexota bacterium]